jgi:hypothetical protein
MIVATKTIQPVPSDKIVQKYRLIAAECCGKLVKTKSKITIRFENKEDSDFFDRIAKNVGIPVEKS